MANICLFPVTVAEVSNLINARINVNKMFTNKFFDKKEAWR